MEMIRWFFILMWSHAIADLALQGQWIGDRKSPFFDKKQYDYKWFLIGHGGVNGAVVYLMTGSVVMGIAETICHTIIDYMSVWKFYNLKVDQCLHVMCKIVWASYLAYGWV